MNSQLEFAATTLPTITESNFSYSDEDDYNDESDFSLFPCRKECKEKLGGKGSGFKDCVRECKGKGAKKSVLKEREADQQAKMTDLLGKVLQQDEPETAGKSNTMIWVVVGVVLVIVIIGAVLMLRKKK